jgi:hypothetical protein
MITVFTPTYNRAYILPVLFEQMIADGEFDELAIVMSEVAKTDIVIPI